MNSLPQSHDPRFFTRPILLVEDNPMDIDLTLQAFQEHNFVNPIVVCQDGEEALIYVESHPSQNDPGMPVLVLLDLRLPKVDGLEVLRRMQEQPVWNLIPVIVLTTSRQNDDIEKAYQLGANSYIVKPVDFESFTEVVKNIKMYWVLTNQPPY